MGDVGWTHWTRFHKAFSPLQIAYTPYIPLLLPSSQLHSSTPHTCCSWLKSIIKRAMMSTTIAKQGIVSILGNGCDQITSAASLRRTLSADMSSKKWQAQNGFPFSPLKRIASSEELANINDSFFSSSIEENKEPGQDDIWRLIQSKKKEDVNLGQGDIWGSIVTKKVNEDEKSNLPLYVHPLVKRSTSSLSEKSLEICTESLGSETGSNELPSPAPSETGEREEEKHETQVTQPQPQQEKEQYIDLEEPRIAKYNLSSTKKSPPKSFPPPIPSLAQRDGPSLHMQPRREDGRLVLEAISIPSQNCLCAHRQDGRLLLTFADTIPTQELDLEESAYQEEDIDEVEEEVFNYSEEEEEEDNYMTEKEVDTDADEEGEEDENEEEAIEEIKIDNDAKELGIFMDQGANYSSGIVNVHRSALLMKKLIYLSNKDPKWSEKLKKINLVDMDVDMEVDVDPTAILAQSLARPPRVARLMPSPLVGAVPSSFNAYEYFWQTKAARASAINPITQQKSSVKNNTQNIICPKTNKNQEMEVLKGNKGDYLVPVVRGCKENKKSLLFWEPHCIATS